jgi:hypothetical protein
MRSFINSRRSSIIICLIISLFFLLIQCIDRTNKGKEFTGTDSEFSQFVGSEKCATCHKQVYDSFTTTGHFLTSEQANQKNIKGSFENGSNVFDYSPGLLVKMEKTDSGLYQVEYIDGIKKTAQRFDITIGSGTRGQTYLSWENNTLTQLPISYLTSVNSWANSPGDVNHVYFDRPINSRCMECHTTYAKVIPYHLMNSPEEFDHHQILYGIGCEKCHGPGAKHVQFETENPGSTIGKYIINPASFSRQQSLDLCSLCHGGRIKSIKPTFSFTSGDKLSDYFKIDTLANGSIDVHGNQYGLLSKSKCFRTSSMTCITCHSAHNDERGNLALYSQKCMTCHNDQQHTFCTIKADKNTISANCIDCHMPKQVSKSIVLELPDKKISTAQLLRTHFIKVYPDATKSFFANKH